MPNISLVTDEMPDLLPMTDRSPGLHISEIITDICVRRGIFKPDGKDDLSTVWAQVGCAFEWAVVERLYRHYPGRFVQPGELHHDDIYLTPDLLDLEEWAIHEVKCSWMSVNQDVEGEKFWRYWTQAGGYCTAVDAQVSYLRVLHINGSYQGSPPEYRLWRREWSRRELDENWRMLKSAGRRLLAAREGEDEDANDE